MTAATQTLPSISPVIETHPAIDNKSAEKKVDNLHCVFSSYKKLFNEVKNKTGLMGVKNIHKAFTDELNKTDIKEAPDCIVLHNYVMSGRYLLENKDFFEQQNPGWNDLFKNMVNILNEHLSEETLLQLPPDNAASLRHIKKEIESCLHENADKFGQTKNMHARLTNFLERSHISTLTPICHFFRISCSTICYGIRIVVSAVNKNPTVAIFVHALNLLSFLLLVPRLLKHIVRLAQCAREEMELSVNTGMNISMKF